MNLNEILMKHMVKIIFLILGSLLPALNSFSQKIEYKYLHANKGNEVCYRNTSDLLQAFVFTAGVRFN
jgi:hypothetical protein